MIRRVDFMEKFHLFFSLFSEEIDLLGWELMGGTKGEIYVHMITRQRLNTNRKLRIFPPNLLKRYADLQSCGTVSPTSLCSRLIPSQKGHYTGLGGENCRGPGERAQKSHRKPPIPHITAFSISEYKIAAC